MKDGFICPYFRGTWNHCSHLMERRGISSLPRQVNGNSPRSQKVGLPRYTYVTQAFDLNRFSNIILKFLGRKAHKKLLLYP